MTDALSLYLASKSPRRKAILEQLGFSPIVIASHAHTLGHFQGDEEPLVNETPQDYVERIAKEKILEAFEKIERDSLRSLPVLSADTTVICDNQILGKPRDENEAKSFLRLLSGCSHEVRTAVCVGMNKGDWQMRLSVSEVHFKKLTEEEINAYVRIAQPYDKAGGYGIQGLASTFISEIRGSYSGIMGLPIYETCALLKHYGLDLFDNKVR